uniref:PHD-type domain-containing protein n=1 Tax=Davidia involucrata TaxID=16924 RepID=A0A5B7BDX4_DAVIN
MMLIQGSLPNSIEAALSFVSDHAKQDFLCDWMPGAETWQRCPKCDKYPHGGCGIAVPVTVGKKNGDNLCSLNFPRSCSQLSIGSTMSENYTATFVYRRRKPQRNPVAVSPPQVSANTKLSDGCLSVISSEAPSVPAKEDHMVSVLELENEAVQAPIILPVECNRGALVSKSESINKCSVEEEPGSEEALESDMHKVLDFCCVNDTCSSSKSNMELGSASLKTEVDDTECSSSGALVLEGLRYDLSEKNICISILKSKGLLEGVRPIRTCAAAESAGTISDTSCFLSCKVCDQSETTLKMLICDNCEEAFHVSCCNPRIKKIPADEWFCHTCLKKKRKILKETTTNKLLNISSEMGRCRNATFKGELGPIAFMLRDTEPYATSVRIGQDFQAEVPDWSGPIIDDVDTICEPLEMIPLECFKLDELNPNKPSRLSSIGNWLQCREVIEGVGEGVDGTICGKWRRAPLFEVQTDDWECFRSVLWDPAHADCAVPQELDTDEVLKQLKYIEMLRPRLDAKRRKLSRTKSVGSQNLTENARNIQTQ